MCFFYVCSFPSDVKSVNVTAKVNLKRACFLCLPLPHVLSVTYSLSQQGMLEYLSAFDEETAGVCPLGSPPRPLALPLVEEEEAVSEPEPEGLSEACEDSEIAEDNLGEGTICTESSQQEPVTKPNITHLSSSPCYYFYQGECP